MRSSPTITQTLLTFQNETVDNPNKIVVVLNNYSSTIGKKTKAKLKITLINSQTKTLILFKEPFKMHKKVTKRTHLTLHLMVHLKVLLSVQSRTPLRAHLKIYLMVYFEIYIKIHKKCIRS